MIVTLNASADSPVYFELNEADEIVIVVDKKDELLRYYMGKSLNGPEIKHPTRPKLCVDDCKDWHIIVTFRCTQNVMVNGLVAELTNDIVVHGLVAEVIKECLKKGSSFDYKDENLHFVDEQIQLKSKVDILERCVRRLAQMQNKVNTIEGHIAGFVQMQNRINTLENCVKRLAQMLNKVNANRRSIAGLSQMQGNIDILARKLKDIEDDRNHAYDDWQS